MLKRMEITEFIYKCVVEPSYRNLARVDSNCAGHIRHKRGEFFSSWALPDQGESDDKRRKLHVYSPVVKSKTCLIYRPWHSSEECKILGDLIKYDNSRPTKYRGKIPVPRENFSMQMGKDSVVNNVADEILIVEDKKVSTAR